MEKNTKIGVLGAGIEGMEMVRYLAAHGFSDVTLYDQNAAVNVELPSGVKTGYGPDYLNQAETCAVVFRSPGIDLKKLGGLLSKGVQLTSATRYFLEHAPCKTIGVTGTKGKGTTSTLIYLMLKEAGKDVYIGGNIGESPLKFLDKLTPESVVVLELSSFQLQDADRSPNVAVLLGVTSDHLDYHNDQDEYWEAKSAIVKFQKPEDLSVMNIDYESTAYYEKLIRGQKILVSTLKAEGDGVHLSGPMIVNCTPPKEGQAGGTCEMICNSGKVALIGKHHLENVLPAVAVARYFGVAIPQIQKVLTTFKGLPHRLEEVATVHDVKYYDDSISTTPETSIAAVRAFAQPVILIAGGSDKGADYTDWGLALQQANNLQCVILIGMMADKMEHALTSAQTTLTGRGMGRHYPLEIVRCKTFEDAMKSAHDKAAPGDVVVLSPAAASFDMFKNYKDRGDHFKALANAMGERG